MKTKLYLLVMALAVSGCLSRINAQANKTLSDLTSPTAVNQSLLPDISNTRDLGSSTLGWRDVYISNHLYLNGFLTMHSPATSNFFVGRNAGNPSVTGSYNTATGRYALSNLTTGNSNTASGAYALYSNTTGHSNTASGESALRFNSTGVGNTATGTDVLHYNRTGSYNTAHGSDALHFNTDGYSNTASGYFSLFSNSTGNNNTANGVSALRLNKTGFKNTATGASALYSNTIGIENTANGYESLYSNTEGHSNTANGYISLKSNTTGTQNTAGGFAALFYNSTGFGSTAIGSQALLNNTIGNYNTAIGSSAGVSTGNLTNATAIGAFASVDASNKVRIGNLNVTSIGGQVGWTIFSDGRYKRNMKENVAGLGFINSLRPVTYTIDTKSLNEHNKKGRRELDENVKENIDARTTADMDKAADEASKIVYSGFVAQEVEAAAKNLGFEFSGVDNPKTEDGLYGLRYDNFIVPLVKAVQELSKMNNEKGAKIDAQQKENDAQQKQLDVQQKEIDQLKAIVFKGNQNGIFSQKSINTSLTDASLEQNIPNPFSNSTSIHYTLPQKFSPAQIVITDNTGKTLKQVNISGAGKGIINVDAATHSAGAYNYSLIIDGKIIGTKQMVLAK